MMKILSLLLGVLLASNSWAQNPYLKHYTVADGLPSNEAYALVQDSAGFIWVGTDRGLARFDGNTFIRYTSRNGLPGHTITNLFLDYQNRVWCVALGNGLAWYDGHEFITPSWNKDIEQQVDRIDHFSSFGPREFYVGFQSTSYQPLLYVRTTRDSLIEGVKWKDALAHPDDLFHYSHSKGDFFAYTASIPHDSIHFVDSAGIRRSYYCPIDSMPINQVIRSPKGGFFLSRGAHVFHLSESGMESFQLPSKTSNALFCDSQGALWVGIHENGVARFESGNLGHKPTFYLPEKSVTHICEDRDGGIWLSTIESGIYHLPYRDLKVYDEQSGLPEAGISQALRSGNNLWLIYRNGSVSESDLSKESLTFKPLGNYRYVFGAFVDSSGLLNLSVDHPNKNHEKWREWRPSSVLYPYRDTLLLATNSGPLIRMRRKGNDYTVIDTLGQTGFPRVYSVVRHPNGTWYLGTKKGLFQLRSGQIQALPADQAVFQKEVLTSTLMGDYLLFSIAGEGLIAYHPDQPDTCYTAAPWMTNTFVTRICQVSDQIWLCSASGIDRLTWDKTNKSFLRLPRIGVAQGLPGTSVSDLFLFRGQIWIMTDQGMAVLPEDILKTAEPSNLYFTSIKVNGLEVDHSKGIELKPHQNNLQISFQSISFNLAPNPGYFYRLLPVDSAWIPFSSNTLTLANLASGDYQLSITLSPAVNARSLPLDFQIEKPWWLRWYVWLITAGIVAVAFYLYFYLRLQKIRREAAYENQINTLNYRALKAQMNPHFIYNALNAIQNFVLQKDVDASMDYLSRFSKLVRAIFENSSRDSVSLRDELKSLQLYVELEQLRHPDRFIFECNLEPQLESLRIAPMVVQPFIENAVLHGLLPADQPGKVVLHIRKENEVLQLSIEDNGVGMDAAKQIQDKKRRYNPTPSTGEKQSGLYVTRKRIEALARRYQLDAQFVIQDLGEQHSTRRGTRVSFNLPYFVSS